MDKWKKAEGFERLLAALLPSYDVRELELLKSIAERHAILLVYACKKSPWKEKRKKVGSLNGLPSDWDLREHEGSLTSSKRKHFIFVII